MTRARALKQTIRARAAKTGERYTTARRHVLSERATTTREISAAATRPAPRPLTTAVVNVTKGAVCDARVLKKTGHDLHHWFDVLDRFGGPGTGHTALARHLHAEHGVDGWYSQGITVAYERARGVRVLNQRVTGEYEVSVTKTVRGTTHQVARAFTTTKGRAAWLTHVDSALADVLSTALAARAAKDFVIRADGQGRFRYKWGTTTVQFYLIPKGEDRVSVVVTQMKIADRPALEQRRVEWRAALAALAELTL